MGMRGPRHGGCASWCVQVYTAHAHATLPTLIIINKVLIIACLTVWRRAALWRYEWFIAQIIHSVRCYVQLFPLLHTVHN